MRLPENVKLSIEGHKVIISGPKGTVEKSFVHPSVKIEQKGNEITVAADKTLQKTIETHIANMITGVTEGYTKKLKIIYAHFPISVEVKGKEIFIKNFMGEKQPRKSKIVGQTKVEVKGQEVFVSGPSKEDVGQTIANLRSATRIRQRDSRIFQDGFYIVE
ncbi:MAG: 50S ribosomal protein L6 [Candidatus Micrarchaeota archaeon]|nr:50S ribosomal protein L6 [Candidatus Micrarchaeota archaeon]